MRVDVRREGHVGIVEMRSPPHNFLTVDGVRAIADALEGFVADPSVRAAVLCAEGRSFCAGADFSSRGAGRPEDLYAQAVRLCEVALPVVAAVQGPAVGGGLGLALTATFRITCPEARFSANFVKLGIHHGFGLSVTLPELVGPHRAAEILLTGRRYKGEEAVAMGLADACVPLAEVRGAALELARQIATGAPLALRAIAATLRVGLGERVRAATAREAAEQARLLSTEDAREGLRAVSERREGRFVGR